MSTRRVALLTALFSLLQGCGGGEPGAAEQVAPETNGGGHIRSYHGQMVDTGVRDHGCLHLRNPKCFSYGNVCLDINSGFV